MPNSWDQLFPNTNPNSKYWKECGLSQPPKKLSVFCDPEIQPKKSNLSITNSAE